MPIELDGTFLFFLGLILVFVGGVYLFVRRTLQNFRQGLEKGRR